MLILGEYNNKDEGICPNRVKNYQASSLKFRQIIYKHSYIYIYIYISLANTFSFGLIFRSMAYIIPLPFFDFSTLLSFK